MIICTDKSNVIVGKIYYHTEMTDEKGVYHTVNLMVMREASKEEYINWCKETNAEDPDLDGIFKYYEISVD